MENKVQFDQQIIDKVYQECCNNFTLAMRRYNFLISTPKFMQPIDHKEVVKAWQDGIRRYKKDINIWME